jgi:uncharacterized protein (TIGR00645 family)
MNEGSHESRNSGLAHVIEMAVDRSRWLLVPAYLGLAVVVLMITLKFLVELSHSVMHFSQMDESSLMLVSLSLVDMVLLANLVLMVLIGGYTNFVSRIDVQATDRPEWLERVDATGIKMKLFGSMVAISGVQVLRAFMNLGQNANPADARETLVYMLVTHLVFVVSLLLLALSDRFVAGAKAVKRGATTSDA